MPANPTWGSYTFDGWFDADGHKFENSGLNASATVYAQWRNAAGKVVVTSPLDFTTATADIDQKATYGYEWNNTSKTLTLSGVTVNTAANEGISVPNGTTVILTQGTENNITLTGTSGYSIGLDCYGSDENGLTIDGTGTLNITTGRAAGTSSDGLGGGGTVPNNSLAIYSENDIVIKNGTITATGGASENGSAGISSGYGNVEVQSSATVTAIGGTSSASSSTTGSCGIQAAGNVTVSGNVTAKGGTATNAMSVGILANGETSTITATHTMTATGNTAAMAATNGITATDATILGSAAVDGTLTQAHIAAASGLNSIYMGAGTDTTTLAKSAKLSIEPVAKIGDTVYTSLAAAIAAAADGQTVTVTGDAKLGRVEIAHNITLAADGNYTVTQTGPILVNNGKTLTLGGGDASKTLTLSGGTQTNDFRLIMVRAGGSLVVHDGAALTSNTMSGEAALGAAVRVAPGSVFTMDGGSIAGCTALKGGAVYVDGPATAGGGAGTFTMTGGKITGCTATGTDAGGGAVYTAGAMNLSGTAAITSCTAAGKGGGVYVYYKAVLWAVEKGITEGTTTTTFSPDAVCSRSQIVTFQYRAALSPTTGTVNPFTDVADSAYYANAVLWAVKEGITQGTTATTFSPNDDCTRAQIVTFIFRQLGK